MALTTNLQYNSEGIANHASGSVITDAGGAVDTTFQLGFAPRIVRWVNMTGRITLESTSDMAALTSIRTIATGVRTLDAAAGLTINQSPSTGVSNSFMVKAADIPASSSFYWEAIA